MDKKPWFTFVIVIIIAMMAVAVVRPNGQINFYTFHKQYKFSQGLDLQGGIHMKYLLDLSKTDASSRQEAIKGVKQVIENRINPLGIAEPVIQTSKVGNDVALIVELPGQKDTQTAIDSIGRTALLTFKEVNAQGTDFVETDLTGADLKSAAVDQNQNSLKTVISLVFTDEGAKKFDEITKRNVGKPVAIYLDDQVLQEATVQEEISGGRAQISGNFTQSEAQTTVRLLKAGNLPVPLKLIEQRTIQASLGQESIHRSLVAGIVGMLLVALFMILYYRMLGIVAVIALILYTLISLTIFKMLPVTLTLAGIAGFILSIGMAVDANILIFERFKEELKEGKSLRRSIHDGFDRAWSSIRDSNASSIMTALILYNFGSSSLVKGFSLTLMIGILVSLFTAITVSRTLLYLLMGTRFMPAKHEEKEPIRERINPFDHKELVTTNRKARW